MEARIGIKRDGEMERNGWMVAFLVGRWCAALGALCKLCAALQLFPLLLTVGVICCGMLGSAGCHAVLKAM